MGYRLLHWGPLIALSIISIISWSSFMCLFEWWPVTSVAAFLNLLLYIVWNITVFYNFFMAVFAGPGYVPFGWKPVSIQFMLHALSVRYLMYVTCRYRLMCYGSLSGKMLTSALKKCCR